MNASNGAVGAGAGAGTGAGTGAGGGGGAVAAGFGAGLGGLSASDAAALAKSRASLNESPHTRADLKEFSKGMRVMEKTSFEAAKQFADDAIKVCVCSGRGGATCELAVIFCAHVLSFLPRPRFHELARFGGLAFISLKSCSPLYRWAWLGLCLKSVFGACHSS